MESENPSTVGERNEDINKWTQELGDQSQRAQQLGEIDQGSIANSQQQYSQLMQVRIEHAQGMEHVIRDPTGYPEGRQVIHEPTGYSDGMRVIKEEETSEDQEREEGGEVRKGERHMKVGR